MSQRVTNSPERTYAIPIDGYVFNTSATTTITSSVIPTQSYSKFLLTIDCDVTGTVTSLDVYVQFGMSNTTTGMHNYESGAFGSLRIATTSADFCLDGNVLADYMAINVIAAGMSATATYSITCQLILNNI